MINTVILQGRLTSDVELKVTQSGMSICHFRFASEDKKDNTLFISCTAWQGTAETIAKYCKKGQEIILQGRLKQNEYTDRQGTRRQEIELNVTEMSFTAKSTNSEPAKETTAIQEPEETDETDEELPF